MFTKKKDKQISSGHGSSVLTVKLILTPVLSFSLLLVVKNFKTGYLTNQPIHIYISQKYLLIPILPDMNGLHPFEDTTEQITETMSLTLK